MTTSSAPRVPNVHAHAVSGLDHVALGGDDRDALNVTDQATAPGTVDGVDVSRDPDSDALNDTTGLIATSETTDDQSGSATDEPPHDPTAEESTGPASMSSLHEELQEQARQAGVSDEGTKQELVDRINAKAAEPV